MEMINGHKHLYDVAPANVMLRSGLPRLSGTLGVNEMRWLVVLVMMTIHNSNATAGESNRCPKNPLPNYLAKNECVCHSDLKRITQNNQKRLTLPGYTLISACNVRNVPESPSDIIGVFHLRGEETLEGMLRIEPTEAGELFFQPSINLQGSTYIDPHFRFANESSARSLLGLPGQSGAQCIEAQATLSINQVSVVLDYGTDYEGTYIVAFKNHRIGAFSPCRN